jgi:hypothetical protein
MKNNLTVATFISPHLSKQMLLHIAIRVSDCASFFLVTMHSAMPAYPKRVKPFFTGVAVTSLSHFLFPPPSLRSNTCRICVYEEFFHRRQGKDKSDLATR